MASPRRSRRSRRDGAGLGSEEVDRLSGGVEEHRAELAVCGDDRGSGRRLRRGGESWAPARPMPPGTAGLDGASVAVGAGVAEAGRSAAPHREPGRTRRASAGECLAGAVTSAARAARSAPSRKKPTTASAPPSADERSGGAERLVPEVAGPRCPRADVRIGLGDGRVAGRDAVVDLVRARSPTSKCSGHSTGSSSRREGAQRGVPTANASSERPRRPSGSTSTASSGRIFGPSGRRRRAGARVTPAAAADLGVGADAAGAGRAGRPASTPSTRRSGSATVREAARRRPAAGSSPLAAYCGPASTSSATPCSERCGSRVSVHVRSMICSLARCNAWRRWRH